MDIHLPFVAYCCYWIWNDYDGTNIHVIVSVWSNLNRFRPNEWERTQMKKQNQIEKKSCSTNKYYDLPTSFDWNKCHGKNI